ncbi:MAG: glycosyltransferase family 4 protein [Anaerolineae bacterium]|nr:glycosyltransferase family 4 protein [Anaerolineae bacterium]
MRLFIASGIFHPEPGGPATYLYRLLPELAARGHSVTALSFGDDPVSGYPYPLVRVSRRTSYPVRMAAYYRAAAHLWPDHDLAYLHTLELPLPARVRPRIARIGGDIAWERATRLGWVAPGTDVATFQSRHYALKVEANKAVRAGITRGLAHVIVPSEHLKRIVLGWGVRPERISVIYSAVDFGDSPLLISQEEARTQLGLLPDAPLLLTVARLVPFKRIDETIRAIAQIPDVHLLIVGDGEIRPALEAQAAALNISGRVHFAGYVPHENLPLYYRAADYTLLYSAGEGLSHVLLESLFAGTPLIASDKGGNPEVVQHGVNGLLTPYPDPDALTETIRQAGLPGQREALAAGTSTGLERFRWETLVAQTAALLESFA